MNGTLIPQNLVDPQYAVSEGNYLLEIQGLSTGYWTPTLPVRVVAGINWEYRITCLQINALKVTGLEPWSFGIVAEYSNFISRCSHSNLIHDTENKMLTVDVSTETGYHDWWGFFVLPRDRMVRTLTGYSGNTSYQLSKFYDYTENFVDDHNIVAVRIPPEMDGLNLTYTIIGDVNGDGIVDIFDAVIIALAFGSSPDDPNWDPRADINEDNLIDIFDIVIVALHFGETEP